jgi:hypothetical protein
LLADGRLTLLLKIAEPLFGLAFHARDGQAFACQRATQPVSALADDP